MTKIIITRPQPFAEQCVTAFAAEHIAAVALPLMAIEKIDLASDDQAYDFYIFTSRNAVRYGAHLLQHAQGKIAAVGQGSAQALQALGFSCDIFPAQPPYDSEALLAQAELQSINGKSIALISGEDGRQHLHNTLKQRGAKLKSLLVYRRIALDYEAKYLQNVINSDDIIICTSISLLQQLAKLLKKSQISAKQLQLGVIHSKMINCAQELGFTKPPMLAASAQDKDIVWMIKQIRQKNA